MLDPIRSRAHPLVRRIRALKGRGADGEVCLLEGLKLLEEAIGAEIAIAEVVASPRLDRNERGRRLLASLAQQRVPVRAVADDILASLSEVEASQGVLALARRPAFDEGRFFTAPALVVVGVGIQDPGNLGGLLRTAEAAGATGAYLAEGCADPFSWKALRGSMGSAFRLPHRRRVTLADALACLRAHDVRLYAAAPAGERYDQADFRGPSALLFGAEGSGLPQRVLEAADSRLAIPMARPVESLNVGVAAGILLFEAARQRRGARSG